MFEAAGLLAPPLQALVGLKIEKVLQLLMLFKKSLKNLITNQTKYEWIKAVNFTIDQWDHG